VGFLRELLNDAEFRQGRLNTGFVADYFKRRKPAPDAGREVELVAALAAAAETAAGQTAARQEAVESRRWVFEGRSGLLR